MASAAPGPIPGSRTACCPAMPRTAAVDDTAVGTRSRRRRSRRSRRGRAAEAVRRRPASGKGVRSSASSAGSRAFGSTGAQRPGIQSSCAVGWLPRARASVAAKVAVEAGGHRPGCSQGVRSDRRRSGSVCGPNTAPSRGGSPSGTPTTRARRRLPTAPPTGPARTPGRDRRRRFRAPFRWPAPGS